MNAHIARESSSGTITRMSSLGAIITQAIVHHYGRDEFLQRLSHPFWFQSFGAVMGMDWHSSGITTSVIGALKRGLGPLQNELGIHVCGGRGQHSRKTPDELKLLGERIGFDGARLTRASRLVAKVDSAAVQDGFDLYLHGFFVADDGEWAVVQQGLNASSRLARRYHWHSSAVRDFTREPHTAIVGQPGGLIQNLVDQRATPAQDALLTIARTDPAQKALHDTRQADRRPRRLGFAVPGGAGPVDRRSGRPAGRPHRSGGRLGGG